MTARVPVSIVCVYNNVDVLRSCLQRSIDFHQHEAPDTELIAVDNTEGRFKTAGAALNHGASLARHDVVAFSHQDVYFHSLAALERSASLLVDHDKIGMLGAVGIRADGSIAGRVRDRVVLLGDVLDAPVDVDSLDEVVFLVPRAQLARMPLTESTQLAWHAYAVEYGMRLRVNGLRVTAGHIPITHNSLTINLDRLDVAHDTVGAHYPQLLPLQTTCGVIHRVRGKKRGAKILQEHRWRYRWLRNSFVTWPGRREAAGAPFVLSDIRLDIDDILAREEPLTIVNHAGERAFEDEASGPTDFTRAGRRISVRSASTSILPAVVATRGVHESMLITNLDAHSIRLIAPPLKEVKRVVGFHEGQYWVLSGPAAGTTLHQWATPQARPLGESRSFD